MLDNPRGGRDNPPRSSDGAAPTARFAGNPEYMTTAGEWVTDLNGWTTEATATLLAARNTDGGWGYGPGHSSATEPTALCALALSDIVGTADVIAGALDYLAQRQRHDGFFTVNADVPQRSWTTSIAATAMQWEGRIAEAAAAADALLAAPVFTIAAGRAQGVYGYDTSIPGWPWTHGDFSFIEPTALGVLFLKRAGRGAADRVRRGVDLLRDRALHDGGWNYGEPEVLNGRLFPTALPTALAMLALADEPDDTTAAGADFLLAQRGAISSLLSLGWTTIALNVYGLLDVDWRHDVVARWRMLPRERQDPMGTALALLGLREGDHPLALA